MVWSWQDHGMVIMGCSMIIVWPSWSDEKFENGGQKSFLTCLYLFFLQQTMGCLNDPGSNKDDFRHHVTWNRLLSKSLWVRIRFFQCHQKTDQSFEKKPWKIFGENQPQCFWDFIPLVLIIGLYSAIQRLLLWKCLIVFLRKNGIWSNFWQILRYFSPFSSQILCGLGTIVQRRYSVRQIRQQDDATKKQNKTCDCSFSLRVERFSEKCHWTIELKLLLLC